MAGDIIVSANGKLMKSASDLREACRSDQVLLLVQRDAAASSSLCASPRNNQRQNLTDLIKISLKIYTDLQAY